VLHQFPKESVFILNLCGRISGGIAGQTFVAEGGNSFADHRIHKTTFGVSRLMDRGSGDSLIISASSGLRQLIPVRTIGSESCVGSVGGPMFTKLQGLFRLTKIEL
jgi:hypothetical protein